MREGEGGGLCSTARTSLAVDVRDVTLDCPDAQDKLACDFTIRLAGGNESQHLCLSLCQVVGICLGFRWLGLGLLFQRDNGKFVYVNPNQDPDQKVVYFRYPARIPFLD